MFNFLLHPYVRWLHGRSQDDGPGFNVDQAGWPPVTSTRHTSSFPTPASEVLLPSMPSTGLASFVVEQPNEIPGFRVGLPSNAPGFRLHENGVPRSERMGAAGMETVTPGSLDIAQTLALPPNAEESNQASPAEPPEWHYSLLAMPLPRMSTAFAPQADRRFVPYEPLINSTTPYSPADQQHRGKGSADAYAAEIGALADPPPPAVPSVQRRASLAIPDWLAVPDTHTGFVTRPNAHLPPAVQAGWNHWSRSPKNGRTHVLRQQGPLPQEQQPRPSNVTAIEYGTDQTGVLPTARINAPSIEHTAYDSDVDGGDDDLFELVGVKENKTKGDTARDAAADRIKEAHPEAKLAKEIRIYAEGAPDYMTADILFRPNGTSVIMIVEVKSGDGKLTSNQLAKLAEAARSGGIYIVNDDVAKRFEISPNKTFSAQGIVPQVYVVGGNHGAIERQMRNLGLDVIPQKVRRGQPPRLRIGARPT